MTESPRSFRTSFTNADLSGGIYTVIHNLNQQFVIVQVSDSNNQVVVPDNIIFSSTTEAAIDLGGYGELLGTWNILVIG
jgi:hypothetical protein